jgi:hypothetical protein
VKWPLLMLLVSCAHDHHKELLPQYQAVLQAHSVKEVMKSCKTIDLRSHPMAWYFRSNIRQHNLDLTKPNFNGQYHLLISPLSGGANWFVADCKTGKVKGTDLVGELLFNAGSSVLVRTPPKVSQYREIYKWNGAEMLLQKNLIEPENL